MKALLVLISFCIWQGLAFAQERMLRCEYTAKAPCQCLYERTIVIDDDGPHHAQHRKVTIAKGCPDDIEQKLSERYWAFSTNPEDHRNPPADPTIEYPKNEFNNSPFAEPLAQGLSWLFSRQDESTLQRYLDSVRNWAPIDPQMAKDVDQFKEQHSNAQGELSRQDQATLDYLKDLLAYSNNLGEQSKLPPRERPTPLPTGADTEEIKKQYSNLYKQAQNNQPLKLNQGVDQILNKLNWMSASERSFHRAELSRTFLNQDMTFKSLPYVENPELSLESDPSTVEGIQTRSRINSLMAAESQAMQNLHGYCEQNACPEIQDSLKRSQQNIRQVNRNIEFLDKAKNYLVDSASFENEAREFINDYTQKLGEVRSQEELDQLSQRSQTQVGNLQEKRIGVKSEILNTWGGDEKLSEKSVSGLSTTASRLTDYARGLADQNQAIFYREMAESALDLALDFTPGVSTAKDFYELVSGETLVGNEKLSNLDRSIRAISVVVDLATVGMGGRITKVILDKGVTSLSGLIKSERILETTSRFITSASKISPASVEKTSNLARSFEKHPEAIARLEEISEKISKSPQFIKAFNETAPGRPAFYLTPQGAAVPATGYRHFGSKDSEFVMNVVLKDRKIPPHLGGENYITFNKFDNFETASSALQVPHDARFRVTVDTFSNMGDLKVPTGKWGKEDWLEPFTKDFPEYGVGGASQASTKEGLNDILEIKDLLTGEILYQR